MAINYYRQRRRVADNSDRRICTACYQLIEPGQTIYYYSTGRLGGDPYNPRIHVTCPPKPEQPAPEPAMSVEELTAAREILGLTTEAFAGRFAVTTYALAAWERGDNPPPASIASNVRRAIVALG